MTADSCPAAAATAGSAPQDLSVRGTLSSELISSEGRPSESVKLEGLLVLDDCQCYFCRLFLVIFQSLSAR
jgi:hypothetical protein